MKNEITINEIAATYRLHPAYVGILSRFKEFPEPTRRIGKNKMYNPAAIAAFFRNRKKPAKRAA
jgi:hypothetical protein